MTADTRRTILWVVFSMSLFLIYDAWNRHNGHPSFFSPAPAKTAAAGSASAPPAGGSVPVPAGQTPAATPAAGVVPGATAAAPVAAPAAERVTITTDLVQATLDGTGGSLTRVELLRQRDPNDPKRNAVVLEQSPQRLYVVQTGVVPPAGGAGLPNHHTPMRAVPGERTLRDGQNELRVQFESDPVGGVKLVKTYTFRRGDYVIGVNHQLVNVSGAPVNPRLYLQIVRDGNPPLGESSLVWTFTGPAIYTDTAHYKKIDFKSIDKREPNEKPNHETSADNGWVAMVQHYFATAWLIDPANGNGPKVPREYFTGKVDTNAYSVGMFVPLGEVAPGATRSFDARLYVGPQEENKLAALAPGLQLVKDYGWLRVIAEPLFWLLTQLHNVIGNWGWSIVGLVVLLKIVFFWLNATAYRSMAKMKAINPKIMEMRERLKDKPQQMQQEMMRIYREEKVNPLGGCLPIVVQMPFFIALYWVLLSSVEMRGAPWIGWITDLSRPDTLFGTIPGIGMPIGLLPILMTLTSLVQTWLNPTPADPVQAKMMWFMPLAFSVMFFFFPSGLVLYWLTNNILSIAQQYLINRQLGVTK
ncbi:membrane protein insertase YidC [Piscinibacter koreensis]|uniref:Membrane protein insertase YidC n=1 Tax=Piscinibacter koreensis TaxID=2742824 RepID=A0A7Y6TUT7_9BURK|nr:membrane protein insertase YidC [Schlegelella koreensis]NUZ04399.1 membrane protein insertase YidC [Schlegelella koreensis]